MTGRYYAAKVRSDNNEPYDFTGPLDTYSAAIKIHADELLAATYVFPPVEPVLYRIVLLDVGFSSSVCSEKELRDLIMTDPMLSAVFKMGRNYEYKMTRNYERLKSAPIGIASSESRDG